jgi:uncharacterized small protein (DUF1192 family)
MNEPEVVSLSQVCEYFKVEADLVKNLSDFGLFPIVVYREAQVIEVENLERLKEILSLHESLGVNKEGIEVILGLHGKIADLRAEIESLRGELDRLKRQKDNEGAEALMRRGLLIEINA